MAGEGKYGGIIVLDQQGHEKKYPPEMPRFVLLAKDRLAPHTVDEYARLLEARGLYDQAKEVEEFAEAMREWQDANPELVKLPD